jgi:hypothetical protein
MGVKPAMSLGFRAAEGTTYTATYTEPKNQALESSQAIF